VDANIVIRLIVEDDMNQVTMIQQAMADHELYVSLTVFLECEWVLRSRYKYTRTRIAEAFAGLIDLENLQVEAPEWILWAIDRYDKGSDFGDVLHLIAVRNTDQFMTLDQKLLRKAGSEVPIKVRVLKY
jgi:predicted nucleic-acid-binding protein